MGTTRAGHLVSSEPILCAVRLDDWRLLREVRLRALEDAPDAFGATLADAQALTDDDWQQRAGSEGLILVAVLEDRPVAMGGARRWGDGPTYFVWGMWTAPEARGQGLGGRILDALVTWCHEQSDRDGAAGALDVRLHVTEGNDAARRLYTGRGFAPTGAWEELRAGSPLQIEELRLRGTRSRG